MLKEEHNFGDNKLLPVGDAMSDTWQWVELSKRFTVKDLWGEQEVQSSKGEIKTS